MNPRGVRINNPGNVRITQDHWQGQMWPGRDKAFCQFDTMAHGVRCTAKVLLGYQTAKLNTVRKIVSRWAPSVENDTRAYVSAVSEACGIAPDAPLSLGQGMLARLCKAIFHHENGGDYVSDADLSTGVSMALGLSAPTSADFGHDASVLAIKGDGATP